MSRQTEYLQDVVDAMPDPVMIVARDLTVTFMNQAAKRAVPSHKLRVGRALCYELFQGVSLPCDDGLSRPVQEVFTGKHPATTTHLRTHPDKRVAVYEVSASPVLNKNREIAEVVEIVRDITDLEHAKILSAQHEELNRVFNLVRIAKQEWEKTMDCVSDMVVLVDSAGRVKRCNRTFAQFTGKPYDKLLGQKWDELLGEHGLPVDPRVGKQRELFHGPSKRWFTATSYPIGDVDSGVGLGFVATFHDFTALKEATGVLEMKNRELELAYSELQMTQARVLQQEKMASIGLLAAGVAHEINNPMGFIASNLGTLDKYLSRIVEYAGVLDAVVNGLHDAALDARLAGERSRLRIDVVLDDAQKLVHESLDGAERVTTIVRDLKTFSRVDQAEKKPASVNECIDATLNIVWNELKYRAVVRKEYGEVPLTLCYPQQLNQVFMNLLMNAAQAIEHQGTIVIRTWHEDRSVFVSIRDSGAGIPEKDLSRIFEPFFTTKSVGKGTGLGLSITYDIVKKHNGELTVRSEVGKGTTFTVRLPIVEESGSW